jgi:hypothetical protein
MPQCPQCNKPLVSLSRQCPSCRADLDLLVEYVNGLQSSLYRAEQLTRTGELGQAMWAYLEVLEVDPDNVAARQQVGQITTAVRQFDRTAPGRRWLNGGAGEGGPSAWLKGPMLALVVLFAFTLGFLVGRSLGPEGPTPTTDSKKDGQERRLRNDQMMAPPK